MSERKVTANRSSLGGELSETDRKIGTFLLYAGLLCQWVRPQEVIPGLGSIPIAGVLIYSIAVWTAFHLRRELFQSPFAIILVIGGICAISGIGAVNVGAYKQAIKYIFFVFPQCAAIYLLMNTPDRVESFLRYLALLYFLIAVITIANGGLGPGSFVRDPNDTSLALSMGLPFFVYMALSKTPTKTQRRLLWIAAGVVVLAIIATRSRGGFVGLAGVIAGMWWLSRKRLKFAVLGLLAAVLLGGTIVSILPDDYVEEIVSIGDPEEDTRVERLHTWEIAWLMYLDNPVIGVGVNNYMFNVIDYQRLTSWSTGNERSLHGRAAHSTYFELLAETGTIGFLVFAYIMFLLPLKLYARRNRILKHGYSDSRSYLYLQILMISMLGYVLAGTFISVTHYPHIGLWIALFAVVTRAVPEWVESSDHSKSAAPRRRRKATGKQELGHSSG